MLLFVLPTQMTLLLLHLYHKTDTTDPYTFKNV